MVYLLAVNMTLTHYHDDYDYHYDSKFISVITISSLFLDIT